PRRSRSGAPGDHRGRPLPPGGRGRTARFGDRRLHPRAPGRLAGRSSRWCRPWQPRRSAMTENTTANETDVVTKLSPLSVADTTAKLTGIIAAKGVKLFDV